MTDRRAAEKQAAILLAAEDVFLRNGYRGTSMDEVAAKARVSKQTLYKHFESKESLFRSLITWALAGPSNEPAGPRIGGDTPLALADSLHAFARHLLGGVMQPRVLQLRRLVIGEANRFPELGRAFHDAGLAAMTATIAEAFTELGSGEDPPLLVDDPELAAQHLIWLVLSVPLNRAMLLGDGHGLSAADLDRYARAGVDLFLAAHGTAGQRTRRARA